MTLEFSCQLEILNRVPFFKYRIDGALHGDGGRLRKKLEDSAAKVTADGAVVHVRKELIHSNKAKFAIKECESDGRIRQHGIKQGQRIVQSCARLLDRGDHHVEGHGEVGGFVC